ncbi:AarF/ABC1/UbiB kinase family protein [Tardiphaga sp.]|uniref:ABC1 kinase family protein n=1 Tax=Tardiphaga sp. TaxID=1926292 RepID=UPI00260998A0|nr:AarF/ABC1/UbiB kinase family protein [Tardiphaga sp.]
MFVKIGQFLALRPDLIASEYCVELMRLFERVPPFPWSEVRRIIRADLGAEPAELFGYLDPQPLAAGSLAQTHYARLRSGREVVIKILRPDVHRQVARDLRHARRLARLLELSGGSFILDPRATIEELAGWLMQELDFVRELRNIQRLRRLAFDSPLQVIPKPYPQLSGDRVLTMDYVRGVHVIDLLAAPSRDTSDIEQHDDIDRGLLARDLIEACLTQIFRYRFFHADLHPGNLIAKPDGGIAFIDFGLCTELDDTVRQRQMHYLAALYRGDNERVLRALLDILVATEAADPEGLRRDFLAAARARIDHDGRSTREGRGQAFSSAIANYLIDVIRAARNNGYQIPTQVLAMYRALLTVELVAHQLGSRADLRSVGRRFIEKLQRDEAFRIIDAENLVPTLLSYFALWRDYPGQASQLLTDLADNRFVLKVNVGESHETEQDRNRRARGLISAILAVSVAVLLAFPGSPAAGGGWITGLLVTLLLLLYLVTYLHYRRLK